MHFWHQHVRDTVVILEKRIPPHTWCPLCDILVPWKALNETHRHTTQCTRGAERRRRRLAAEEEREVTTRAFSAYGLHLEMVTYFKYLGRVILEADEDWPVVVKKLSLARKVWSRMSYILSREGAVPRVYCLFFQALDHAGGGHPGLRSEDESRLYHILKK